MNEWRRELTNRIENLHLRPEREAEIVEELSQHLDDRVHELIAGGAAPEIARATALADLDTPGTLERRLAEIEARQPLALPPPGAPSRGRWLQARWQDLRYSIRSLRRSPAYTTTVLVTLGLTIGPTTALLSIGNWLLWRPTPGVTAPDRLGFASFEQPTPKYSIVHQLSVLNIDDLRQSSRTLAAIVGFSDTNGNVAAGPYPAQYTRIGFVNGGFFGALGVRITAGRGIDPADDRWPDGNHVVVLSDGLARRAFGGAAAAVGKGVLLNGRDMTVVGVVTPEFIGTEPLSRVDVWAPGAARSYANHVDKPAPVTRASGAFNSFVVRLAPGASFATAKAELDVLLAGLVEKHPGDTAAGGNNGLKAVRANIAPGLGLGQGLRDRYAKLVGTLVTVGAVLLLLGCANVANLMMMRGVRLHRERAVRLALGASGGRLAMLQLTESGVLAAGGALAGIALAFALKQFVATLLVPAIAFWNDFAVPLDQRVLAMTLGLSVGCGLIAGLVPAFLSARTRSTSLVENAAGRATSKTRRFRAGLAAAQLALSLALVIGAFMLVATLRNLSAIDLGFNPDGVTQHRLDASRQGYSPDTRFTYYREVFERVRNMPGWTAVSLSHHVFGTSRMRLQDPAGPGMAPIIVNANAVTGAYFDVIGMRVTRGRALTDQEALSPPAASPPLSVINEQLARRLFGDGNAIGPRVVVLPGAPKTPPRELRVIGVVNNAKWDVTGEPVNEIYLPLTSRGFSGLDDVTLLVKSALPLRRVSQQVEATAMAVDPAVPIRYSAPFNVDIQYKLADRITFAWVLSMLGWLGFALAAVGLYGLLAQSVTERTREFGIRMAIGGERSHIFALVLRQAAWIGAIGTVTGLGLAIWGSRLIEAQLFGVTRWTPGIYAAAAIALAGIVFLAGLLPARTATRIAPVDALRVE